MSVPERSNNACDMLLCHCAVADDIWVSVVVLVSCLPVGDWWRLRGRTGSSLSRSPFRAALPHFESSTGEVRST